MTDETKEKDQDFGSSLRLQASLVDELCPIGIPLIAKYKKGFAFKTIGHRLPVILTKVIDQLSQLKNDIGHKLGMDARDEVKAVVGALSKLKNEMQTNKSIQKTGNVVWDDYLELMGQLYCEGKTEEVKWYFAPWLFVECYMYKRIYDAFQSTKFLKDYDIFQKQKEEDWLQSMQAVSVLGQFYKDSDPTNDKVLEEMLEISLWGNRCDLSISQGESNSQKYNIIDQLQDLKKFILCDDSAQFWQYLKDNNNKQKTTNHDKDTDTISIGYILDNAGFELFTDLCFADSLMSKVDRIDFHVKVMPWFVSDALRKDFVWLIDSMINTNDNQTLQYFGKRWKSYLETKKWTVIENPFWTYPHAYHEMASADPALYSLLQRNTLLIFKGDLNYRKLIGDINWLPETPFKDSLKGFWPTSLVTLRTLKADCVSGLRLGLAKEIQEKNPDWMVTGDYGVIQFCGAS